MGEEVPDAPAGRGTAWGLSLFSSTRLNRTNNVLRTSENIDGSGVWENALGMSLNGPSLVSRILNFDSEVGLHDAVGQL